MKENPFTCQNGRVFLLTCVPKRTLHFSAYGKNLQHHDLSSIRYFPDCLVIRKQPFSKMVIFRKMVWGKFADFTSKALDAIEQMGITHVWYTGVLEHTTATDYSAYEIPQDPPAILKGKAGSPYAIKDYYDVSPDLATSVPNRMKEFEELVARTHKAGMKVIIDFVPNHVARNYHSDVKPDGVEDFGYSDDSSKNFDPNNNFYYVPNEALSLSFTQDHYKEDPAKAYGQRCISCLSQCI